jgi:hypothetical protein
VENPGGIPMVDRLSELSELSQKLNQNSDRANSIIAALNKKLAAMNFGLEVWLDYSALQTGDWETKNPNQTQKLPRQKQMTYLGYCHIQNSWQLAAKSGTLVEDYDRDSDEVYTELTEVIYEPLLKTSRERRVKALPLVPRLLDELKREAESVLRSIDEAEKVADMLTGKELQKL